MLVLFGLLSKPEHVTGAAGALAELLEGLGWSDEARVAPAPGRIGRLLRGRPCGSPQSADDSLLASLPATAPAKYSLSCAEHGARLGRSFTGRLYVDG